MHLCKKNRNFVALLRIMLDKLANIDSYEKWKTLRYSAVLSRGNFNKLLHDDFALMDDVIFDYGKINANSAPLTYKDYVSHVFRYLTKHYRNEYIIKNALLNHLIDEYGTSQTIALNEFAIGTSIADMVLFNGCSKAFEIKTEHDSPKRLASQISNYSEIFQYCYLVAHEDYLSKYQKEIDANTGIIKYYINRGHIYFEEIKPATKNTQINPYLLMRCLRTEEYKMIVRLYYGSLPEMNAFTAFTICEQLLSQIPAESLHQLFIQIIKGRKNNMKYLKKYDKSLRQMCLSMHLFPNEYKMINEKLLTPIKI